MLDRESTFANPTIVELLKTDFVPVAIDQACQRRQKDTEGEFYRKIASQSPRNDFTRTTQGYYIATASGDLLLYNNNRDPEKVQRLLEEKLDEFKASVPSDASAISRTSTDPRYTLEPPKGGLVLRVQAKILDGYEPTDNRWEKIFQSAVSRDNLWVTAEEHQQLVKSIFPESLAKRIARFHLVDNTRGEPTMWEPAEVEDLEIVINDIHVEGKASLKTTSGKRGYETELQGVIGVVKGHVVRLDMVALGKHWGDGTYTKRGPKGRYPLAISFTLADGKDIADGLPPQGSRGWVDGYLK